MDDLKKYCLDILLEIDRICKKYSIDYYLYAGTLLGAVRHKGFIPWDDDIDVVMFRKDYNRFLDICNKESKVPRYELQTIETDPYTNNPWAKLHDKNTAFISGFRREEAMEGVNIDIFPIDNAPDNSIIRKVRGILVDKCNYIYQFRFAREFDECTLKMRIFRKIIACIPPWDEMKFKRKYDKYIQKYNKKNTKYVVYLSNRKYRKKVALREWFEQKEYMEFEGMEFPVPEGWREILISLYGENYMELPPPEQRVTQHGTKIIDLTRSWREYMGGKENEKV